VKRWGLAVALLASLGLNLGLIGTQLARRWSMAPEGGRGGNPGDRLAERLGLEGETRVRFLEIQRRMVATIRDERRALGEARRALRAELVARAADEAEITRRVDEIAERQRAIDRAVAASVLESRKVLDGRQLELYLVFVERFTPPARLGERLRERFGEGFDRGGPPERERRGAPPP
jgi:Spy/CpxP family protein refolding chaperone